MYWRWIRTRRGRSNEKGEKVQFASDIAEILPLITTIELRDAYTQGHSRRVAQYAKEFANYLQLDKVTQENIYLAGLLHDVGKVGIPDTLLLKPTKLTSKEYEIVQLHSTLSGQIVSTMPHYAYLADMIAHHHENWDGSGYPDGLQAEEIPLESRILSLADVFDALTTKRIYRPALSLERAIAILQDMQKSRKFDPNLFDKFIEFIKKYGIDHGEYGFGTNQYKEMEELRNNFFFKDSLTSLLNREAILTLLRKIGEYGYKTDLILINFKNFREYNKEHGLKKGDKLLQAFATFLRTKLKAKTKIEEPALHDIFLGRARADKFILIHIGQRGAFLEYKLSKILEEFSKKYNQAIELDFLFLNKDRPLPKNIEKETGYLL